ncbi:DUF4105 domain-containing protein [Ancylobacter sp. A5.8]|uniref:Lnb N-terminal periplasmic domain-containing protein n=1 Tax=Ancylobacter gelatini TaxID=2919920 RepID=UPI001F4D89A4|nr:DUF4105 domain-containing protein [Ancylobacter gelatini]MCJ8142399.1 DUF4105 domain-containing protein [Ancylobacter gelatini]
MTSATHEPASAPARRAGRQWPGRLGAAVLCVAAVAVAAWSALAVFYQAQGVGRGLGWALVALGSGGVIALAVSGRRLRALGMLALGVVLVGLWWATIRPSNERDWAPDVARGVTAEFAGREVTVHNIRDFDWRTEDEGEPRWETRRYDLDDLASVDLFSSTWGNPAIAHTLISFGFRDGRHLVFSAEIRREAGESFSEIGGFFKEFELVLIAADERDIIRLRTNLRREDVSLFPLNLSPQVREALFLSYLELGNELAAQPRWYQTVTTNCTTVIFKLVRAIEPGLPLDWRILISGYLPDYLYERGIIAGGGTLDEVKARARIGERARAEEGAEAGAAEGPADGAMDFSARIRAPAR